MYPVRLPNMFLVCMIENTSELLIEQIQKVMFNSLEAWGYITCLEQAKNIVAWSVISAQAKEKIIKSDMFEDLRLLQQLTRGFPWSVLYILHLLQYETVTYLQDNRPAHR